MGKTNCFLPCHGSVVCPLLIGLCFLVAPRSIGFFSLLFAFCSSDLVLSRSPPSYNQALNTEKVFLACTSPILDCCFLSGNICLLFQKSLSLVRDEVQTTFFFVLPLFSFITKVYNQFGPFLPHCGLRARNCLVCAFLFSDSFIFQSGPRLTELVGSLPYPEQGFVFGAS